MKEHIQVDPAYHARRWVSYLDLLGFTELIRTEGWVRIFSYYKQAIEYYTRERGFDSTIEKTWFSDTFLLYSPDDTAPSFAAIEATTRWFAYSLVSAGIPVRGAISCAELYADKQNNVFFGKALAEAYHYGENQNWIGFVLTPSCDEQMAAVGLPADQRLNYAYWNIPYKRLDKTLQKTLPACILGGSIGRNACLDKLHEMRTKLKATSKNVNPAKVLIHKLLTLLDSLLCGSDKLEIIRGSLKGSDHVTKYENTISFIEANKSQIVGG